LLEKSKRTTRMADLIQTIVARLLQREISDPRLQGISITGVDLSPDLKNAIVFFSLLEPSNESIKIAERAFGKASGFFRVQLSRSTELRHTPKLIFKYDASIMIGTRVSQLLKNVSPE